MKPAKIETSDSAASRFIHGYSDGALDTELSARLEELTTALRTEAANRPDAVLKGSLTLKLSFTAQQQGKRGSIVVETTYDVQSKIPAPSRPGEMFFIDKSGDLVRDEPRQTKLGFERENASETQQ
jgi:hypothetical protein